MLKFSKQADNGLVLMLALTQTYVDNTEQWVSLRDVAEQNNLSYRFLTQIIRRLKKAKLVLAKEGISGGYKLAKNPKHVSVADVLRSIVGNVEPTTCTTKEKCCKSEETCLAKPVWLKVQKTVDTLFEEMSLLSLLPPKAKKS
jgi:Rrf2 family protein